jgi:RNA polymerase sigma-70 factor (ECF subfamily)
MGAGDRDEEPRTGGGGSVMRQHGAVLARVCMALLGDAAAAERALERVAREAGVTKLEDGKSALAHVMGLARVACANQLSKLPIRTSSFGIEESPDTLREAAREPALARAAVGRLKPTEREAVVLHLVGGLDAAQVAEACGIDLATARARIARGVAQLVQEEKRR